MTDSKIENIVRWLHQNRYGSLRKENISKEDAFRLKEEEIAEAVKLLQQYIDTIVEEVIGRNARIGEDALTVSEMKHINNWLDRQRQRYQQIKEKM